MAYWTLFSRKKKKILVLVELVENILGNIG